MSNARTDGTSFAALRQQVLDAITAKRWRAACQLMESMLAYDHNESRCELLNDLATLYRLDNRHEAAICHLRVALEEYPEHAFTHAAMGTVLSESGREVEAQRYFDRAISLAPHNAEFHLGRAENLLLLGRYSEGWNAYEWRWRTKWRSASAGRHLQSGEPPNLQALEGTSLLLVGEVGYGDYIMFARYLPPLLERVQRLSVVVPEPLQRLFSRSFPACILIVEHEQWPESDYVCSIMSLPRLFNTEVATIPATFPYLNCDSAAISRWRHRIKSTMQLQLGVVWRGALNRSIERYPLRARSVSLDYLLPMLEAGWEWHAIQLELSRQEQQMLAKFSNVQTYDGLLNDFTETAALLKCMDAVITVDTSVAHLSLALGCPTAVLLPPGADYRWQKHVHTGGSTWYPLASIYKRTATESWQGPIARLMNDLRSGRLASGHLLRPEPRIRVEYAATESLIRAIHHERQENQMAQKITINGKEYDFENLSETARNQIMNLRVADSRIIQLEQDLALAKTARAAYAGLLSRELPKESA